MPSPAASLGARRDGPRARGRPRDLPRPRLHSRRRPRRGRESALLVGPSCPRSSLARPLPRGRSRRRGAARGASCRASCWPSWSATRSASRRGRRPRAAAARLSPRPREPDPRSGTGPRRSSPGTGRWPCSSPASCRWPGRSCRTWPARHGVPRATGGRTASAAAAGSLWAGAEVAAGYLAGRAAGGWRPALPGWVVALVVLVVLAVPPSSSWCADGPVRATGQVVGPAAAGRAAADDPRDEHVDRRRGERLRGRREAPRWRPHPRRRAPPRGAAPARPDRGGEGPPRAGRRGGCPTTLPQTESRFSSSPGEALDHPVAGTIPQSRASRDSLCAAGSRAGASQTRTERERASCGPARAGRRGAPLDLRDLAQRVAVDLRDERVLCCRSGSRRRRRWRRPGLR